MKRVVLLVMIIVSMRIQAQRLSRLDATAGIGVCMQFSKIVNEKIDAGPHVSTQIAWRVKDSSGLSLCAGFDYLRSTFGTEHSIEDSHAWFFTLGLRFETKNTREFFNPFLSIDAGSGKAVPQRIDGLAYASIINTCVMFGAGFTMNVWQRTALVPVIRLVVGEGSAFSIPMSVGLRYDF